jgi:hypothetical protein
VGSRQWGLRLLLLLLLLQSSGADLEMIEELCGTCAAVDPTPWMLAEACVMVTLLLLIVVCCQHLPPSARS